jgi:hypothetical protein
MTTTCRALSYAIAAPARAVGTVAGVRCVHVVPFHVQVSARKVVPALPPNSTVTPRAAS